MTWRRLAFAWLVVLTALNIYRAATWSITIDEARVFNDFIIPPFRTLFNLYDACYHVLHTWLSRLTVAYLGRSELVVRLPGLIAALWYFAAVWKLSNRVLGPGPRHLLAVVLLSANPLILDHLSLARGYGLALTLFTWAFYHLTIAAQEGDLKRIRIAGYLLGLSVASNLTFVIPVAGLTVMFAVVWIRRVGWRPAWGTLIDRFLLPMMVPPLLILMIPLTRVQPDPFYFGAVRLQATTYSLLQHSLTLPGERLPEWATFVLFWALPVVAALVVVAAISAWKKPENAAALALVFAAGTIGLSLIALVVAHRWAGMPYPLTRTGLYLVSLTLLAWLAAVVAPVWSRGALRAVPWIFGVILTAVGLQFVVLTSSRAYQEFYSSAEIKLAVQQLRRLQPAAPKTVTIGGSWEYMDGVDYYRARYRLRWISKVDRQSVKPGFDYYFLKPSDADWIEKLKLRKVWTGPRTGIMVAVP